MTIEERIHQLKFGSQEFDPNDFNDWVKENEFEAYLICLQIARSLLNENESLRVSGKTAR